MFNDLKDKYNENENIHFNENDDMYRYIRPLLGMGYRFEFITKSFDKKNQEAEDENDFKKKKGLKKEASGLKIIIQSNIEDNNIKRFKSPITFKVFDNYIYLVVDRTSPIHSEIYNKAFSFTAFYKKDEKNTPNHITLGILKTPKKNQFNILDFLDLEEVKQ